MAGSKKRRAKAAKKQHHNNSNTNTNTKQHEVLPSTNKESSVELEEEECLESMADEGEEIVTPKTPGKDAEGDMDMPIKEGAVNENGNGKENVNASEEDEGSMSPKTPARDTEPEPVNGSMHAEDASSACANEEVLVDGNLGAHPEPEAPIPATMDSSTVETDPSSDVNEADPDANSVNDNPPINKEESTTCTENEMDSLAVAESQNVTSVEVNDIHGMEPEALSVSNDPRTESESRHEPLQEVTKAVSDNNPEALEDMEAPSIPEVSPEEAEADPGTQSVNETVPEETVNIEGETVHVTPPADEVNFAEPDATPPPADILAQTEAPSTVKPADAETEASVPIETTEVELKSSLPADATNTEPEASLPMKANDEEPEASLSSAEAESEASFAIEAADAKPDGLLATEAEAADVESEASFALEATDAKPEGLLATEAEASDVEPEGSLPTEAEAADVDPEGSLPTEATDEVPEGSLPTEATDGDIEAPLPARTSDAEEASLPTDTGGAPLSTDEEGEASPPIKATGVEGEAPPPNKATDAEVEAPSPTEATDAEIESPSPTEATDAEVEAPSPTEAADAEVDVPPPPEATATIGESSPTTEVIDAEGEAPLTTEAEIEAPLSTETTNAEEAAAHSIEPSFPETEVPAPNVQDSTISENKESDIPSVAPEADVAPVLVTEADGAEAEGVLSEVCTSVEVRDIDEYPVAVTEPSAGEEKEGETEIPQSQEVVEMSEVRDMEAESLQPANVEVVEIENPSSIYAVEINEVQDQTPARNNMAEAEKVEPDIPSQGEDSQMAMIEVCEATDTELGAPATVEDVPIQDVEPASDGVLESPPESCKLGSHVLVSEQENPLTQIVSSEGVSEPAEHQIKNEEEHHPESNDEQTLTDVPFEEAQQAEVTQQLDSTILGIEETIEITDRSGFTQETVAQEIDANSDHVSVEGKDAAEQTSVQPEALDSEYDRAQFEVETTLSELEKDIGEEEATSSVAVEVGSVRTDFDDTNIPDEQDLENTHPSSEEGGIVFEKEFDNCPILDRAESDVPDPEVSNNVTGIHSVALPNGEHVQFLKDSAIATGGGSPEDYECNGEAHSVPNPVEDEQLNGQAHSDDQDVKEINEDQISELGAYSGKWKHAAVIPEEAIGLVYPLEEKSLAPNSSKAVDDLLPASTPVLENETNKAEIPMAIESTNNIVATDTTGKDVGLVVNNETPQAFLNQSSQAASKPVTVAVQKDRVVDRDATITASGVTIGRRTNWIFSCCGLLDLLLGRDQ